MPRTVNAFDTNIRKPKLSSKLPFSGTGRRRGFLGLQSQTGSSLQVNSVKKPIDALKRRAKKPLFQRNSGLKKFRPQKISVNKFGVRQTRRTGTLFK